MLVAQLLRLSAGLGQFLSEEGELHPPSHAAPAISRRTKRLSTRAGEFSSFGLRGLRGSERRNSGVGVESVSGAAWKS